MKKAISIFSALLLVAAITFYISGVSNASSGDLNSDPSNAAHIYIYTGKPGATVTFRTTGGATVLGPGTADGSGLMDFNANGVSYGTYLITAVKGVDCVNQQVDYSYRDQAFYVTLGACQD